MLVGGCVGYVVVGVGQRNVRQDSCAAAGDETPPASGILTSQFIRFSRIILRRSDFVWQMALLISSLVAKGYSAARLCRMTRRLIARFPEVYPFAGRCHLFRDISRALHRLGH